MAGNSNSGGPRKGSGRKSNAEKLLLAGFSAPWFTPEMQKTKWSELINSDDEKIVLEVMKYVTDRLHGKAKQALEHSGKDGEPIKASVTLKFVDTAHDVEK